MPWSRIPLRSTESASCFSAFDHKNLAVVPMSFSGNMPSQGVRHQAVAWGGLSHYIYGRLVAICSRICLYKQKSSKIIMLQKSRVGHLS